MTLHTLNAYLDAESGLYHYDDAPKGVFKEPLVRSTTDAIHCILLSAGLWDDSKTKPERVTLRFSNDETLDQFLLKVGPPLESPVIALHYRRKDQDMCLYGVQGVFPQSFIDEMDFMDDMSGPTMVELCEHLLDYFKAAPESFYCQVSIPAASTPDLQASAA